MPYSSQYEGSNGVRRTTIMQRVSTIIDERIVLIHIHYITRKITRIWNSIIPDSLHCPSHKHSKSTYCHSFPTCLQPTSNESHVRPHTVHNPIPSSPPILVTKWFPFGVLLTFSSLHMLVYACMLHVDESHSRKSHIPSFLLAVNYPPCMSLFGSDNSFPSPLFLGACNTSFYIKLILFCLYSCSIAVCTRAP